MEEFFKGNPEAIKNTEIFFKQHALTKNFPQLLMIIIDNPQVSLQLREFMITQLKQIIEKFWQPCTEKTNILDQEDKI